MRDEIAPNFRLLLPRVDQRQRGNAQAAAGAGGTAATLNIRGTFRGATP